MIKIYYIEVNIIYTTNGKPTQKSIDNLVTVSKPFYRTIRQYKRYNKCREKVVNIITNEHLSELQNKKSNNIIVKGDEIIQIGTVFYNYGTGEINRNIVVIKPEYKEEICDDLENIEVVRCNSEKELLLEWCNVINTYNPDFITGYNIFGFDFNYIIDRVDMLFQKDKVNFDRFYNLGRIKYDSENYKKYYNKHCKK